MLSSFDNPRDFENGTLVKHSIPDLEIYLPTYVAWRKNEHIAAVDAFVQFFIRYPMPGMTPSELVADSES